MRTFMLAMVLASAFVVGAYLVGGAFVARPLVRAARRTPAFLDVLDPDAVADRRTRLLALAATAMVAWPYILASRPNQSCVHHDRGRCKQVCPNPDCELPPF